MMKRVHRMGLMVLVGLMAVSAYAFEVELNVTEPAGVDRTAAPISGGIPLPAGQFKPGQPLALFDGEQEVPLQATPLVVDPDGFLRWILLDFQTDLRADQVKPLTLRAVAASAAPASPLKLVDQDGVIEIDTGAVSFAVSKSDPSVVLPARITYTDGHSGETFVATGPESVEIEYVGPLRATVRLQGRFEGDTDNRFLWIARVTTWAGHSEVQVKYSLANSNPDQYTWRMVADSTVELTLPAAAEQVTLGAGGVIDAGDAGWLHQGLLPNVAGNATAGRGDESLWTSKGTGDLAQGWISVAGGGRRIAVADIYFEADPPRKLAAEGDTLRLSGVTDRFKIEEVRAEVAQMEALEIRIAQLKAQLKQGKDKEKSAELKKLAEELKPIFWGRSKRGVPYWSDHRWLTDSSHLSSQYVIDLAAPQDPQVMGRLVRGWRDRPTLLAAPAYYLHNADALPFGLYGTQADEMAAYDAWGWSYDPADAPKKPVGRAVYGRVHPGVDNHYTPEEDVVDQLLIMYLRTGQRSYYTAARTSVNYQMDLYAWRTDGWRWKDGGVWWYGGPKGSAPQRVADPVTGKRNKLHPGWELKPDAPWTRAHVLDCMHVTGSKSCYCHDWAGGLFEWYLLTGDRDALEAGIDRVEQDYDTHDRAFKMKPGKTEKSFQRSFARASYNAHAGRFVKPDDEFLIRVSDYFFQTYRQRAEREPRGLVNAEGIGEKGMYKILGSGLYKSDDPADTAAKQKKFDDWVVKYAGEPGVAAMQEAGVAVDFKTGVFTDGQGHQWEVLVNPHTWMFPPLSRAMELYFRLTGNEDAQDWTVAYGQVNARVIYQPHANLSYKKMLGNFPTRGVTKDYASWMTDPETNPWAEGVKLNSFFARFYPDVCARAYTLCGEMILKDRARDFWFGGTHRGYNATEMTRPLDAVIRWVNFVSDHDGQVEFVGRTFYEWANPRAVVTPPAAVTDLAVKALGAGQAEVTLTVPAGAARVQVKCAPDPIVDYVDFLEKYDAYEDGAVCNWWMAANVAGEPAGGAGGERVSFVVTGVPQDATCFAVRTFDASSNRSAISNIARAGATARGD